jgi:hypothetical protein
MTARLATVVAESRVEEDSVYLTVLVRPRPAAPPRYSAASLLMTSYYHRLTIYGTTDEAAHYLLYPPGDNP